jgi:hypothetical protein
MGKREELLKLLKSYADDRYITKESTYLHVHFMKGVFSAVAEFVFDDEKTPLDVDIESVKTKWFSQHELPIEGSGGTYMIVKYTDTYFPKEGLLRYFNGRWIDYHRTPEVRPFTWTRIPE